MDKRRKRAVVLAAVPASLSGAFVAVAPRISNNRHYQILLGLWLLVVVTCLAYAMRQIISLKRDGDPY